MQNTFPVSNEKLEEHVNDMTKHVTAEEKSNWNNVGAIGFPDYGNAKSIFNTSSGISSAKQYKIESNGYLLINVSIPSTGDKWYSFILYINGTAITIGNFFTESHVYKTSNTGILLPIANGSSIYPELKQYDTGSVVNGSLTYDVWFIPMK